MMYNKSGYEVCTNIHSPLSEEIALRFLRCRLNSVQTSAPADRSRLPHTTDGNMAFMYVQNAQRAETFSRKGFNRDTIYASCLVCTYYITFMMKWVKDVTILNKFFSKKTN